MRALAAIGTVLLHGALLFGMSALPEKKSAAATKLVEMKVRPPPPKPPPEPEKPAEVVKKEEPPPPPPEVKPQVVKKKTVEKVVADEPKPAEQKPKIPPQGFSVDMSNTVAKGDGVAVPAIDGGGNMFADPKDKSAPPGQKTSTPQPQQQADGKGKGTAPAGAYQVTSMPEWLSNEEDRTPPYPPDAKEREVEGQVILKVYVGTEGRVTQVRIVKKLDPSCDEVAIKWAKEKFRFKPAMLGDEAVGMWIDVPVTFVIDR